MQAINITNLNEVSSDFFHVVRERSGQPVEKCYQCGKCTAGCPLASYMDIVPNQVMRMVQLGMKEELLKCQTIWLCAYCSTCSIRCPRNVNLAEVMDCLRIMAKQVEMPTAGRSKLVAIFNDNFLSSIRKHGRFFEFGAMLGFNLKSRRPFKEAYTGLAMLKRGKMRFTVDRPKGLKEINNIFSRVREFEED